MLRLRSSNRTRAVGVMLGVFVLVSVTAARAQPAPWRLAQGLDGTLYLLADGQRFVVQPDPISDDELANFADGGSVGSVLLAALPVSGVGSASRASTPAPLSTPFTGARSAQTSIALGPPTGMLGTRQNPIGIRTTATLEDGWQLSVVVTQPDAASSVVALDPGNHPPPPAYQFFLSTITATNTGPAVRAFRARERLRAVGPASVPYFAIDNACGVIPNPFVESEVPPGSVVSGNLCWTVQSRDAKGLVLYDVPPLSNADADVTRKYFALHP